MAAPSYLPRLADDQLARGLRAAGAVLLEGPKACGKTSTATRQAKSSVRLDASPQIRVAALADPTIVLPGAVPHLIDEWQLVPESWNAVRAEIDTRQESGQFILTGSGAVHTRPYGPHVPVRVARLRRRGQCRRPPG